MAFNNDSFIQKLRMNNVFPAEGRGNPNPLIGMPDFTYPQQQAPQQAPQQIQQQQQAPAYKPPPKPEERFDPYNAMASAWIPGAADLNAARIVLGETPRQEHERSMELSGQKLGVQYGNLAVKSRQQDLREKVEAGKATDAEKQEYAKELLQMKGGIESGQIDQRGGIQKDIAGMNITGRKEVAGMNNTAAMDRLGKSITSREGVEEANRLSREGISSSDRTSREGIAGANRAAGMNPSQLNMQQENNARKLATIDPELGKFMIIEPGGGFSIGAVDGAEPTPEQRLLIQRAIYGSEQSDINLPNEGGGSTSNFRPGLPTSQQPKVTMPTTRTPSANDPMGIR